MRLQLRATRTLTAVVLLAAGLAHASEDAEALHVDVYTDENLLIVNQSGAARVETPEGLRASGHYGVDMISGATRVLTVDAVTSATKFKETRVEGGAGLGASLPDGRRFDLNYTTSREPDYKTHALQGAVAGDLLGKQVTATLALALSREDVGSAQDLSFQEATYGVSLHGTWAHVLTPGTVLTLLGTAIGNVCGTSIGCQASPYRFAAVALHGEGSDSEVLVALRERHPSSRARAAVAARVAQSVGHGVALHGGYRLYADSWSVVGHTADAAVAIGFFADRWVVRGEARAALQSAASFASPSYAVDGKGRAPGFRTADRELGAISDVMLGARTSMALPSFGPLHDIAVSVRVARLWYRYTDAPLSLSQRDAWLAGCGLGASFL